MSGIRPLDPSDPEALVAWHATYLAADTHERQHPTPWMLEEMRADFLGSRTGEEFLEFLRAVITSGHAPTSFREQVPPRPYLSAAFP